MIFLVPQRRRVVVLEGKLSYVGPATVLIWKVVLQTKPQDRLLTGDLESRVMNQSLLCMENCRFASAASATTNFKTVCQILVRRAVSSFPRL